jgi:hypothetical protein
MFVRTAGDGGIVELFINWKELLIKMWLTSKQTHAFCYEGRNESCIYHIHMRRCRSSIFWNVT